MKDFESPNWQYLFRWFKITIVVAVTYEVGLALALYPFRLISSTQLTEYQAGTYALLSLGVAFLFAAIVDKRIEKLERKIENARSNNCPRGHVLPVDDCPFCRRDSRYL